MQIIFSITLLLIFPTYAYSYIGPGMGGGAIAAFLGIIIAIIAAIFGIIWFPIKRLLKRKKLEKEEKKIKK